MTNIEAVESSTSTEGELYDLNRKVEGVDRNPEIKRDGKLFYCKVHRGDTTESIRKRLSAMPQFSYLSDSAYAPSKKTGRSINGFNITNSALKPGMDLMVPIKIEDRQVGDVAFKESCEKAINNMKSNSVYGKRITKLANKVGIKNLARVMAAFARVETASGSKSVKIGTGGLYRYESTETYSLSYYHIIPKSEWAGGKALKNLGMTNGDTCNPIKAGMLFLGFRCESVPNDTKLEQCLNGKGTRYKKAAGVYNSGSAGYPRSLLNSY